MDDDLLVGLGALALGSRLKRLADGLMQDGMRIYQSIDAEFEPRWFPVFMFLNVKGPTSITGLARGLGVTHPGINKIANELIAARLVTPYRDRTDKRKRVLALTSVGREKQKELEPTWRLIRRTLQGLVDEGGGDFLKSLQSLEASLADATFYDRFISNAQRPPSEIEIITYRGAESDGERYRQAYIELNEAWIGHYFEVEEADRRVLNDPDGSVLANGGEIIFAIDRASGQVLGTCTLLKLEADKAELAKMAVTEQAKGRQLGRRLGEEIVKMATEKGYKILCLESNRKLTPAISLYTKLGFVEQPFPHPSDYSRADIYMELKLGNL